MSCRAQSKSVPWATAPMAPSDWLGTSKNSNILNQPSAPGPSTTPPGSAADRCRRNRPAVAAVEELIHEVRVGVRLRDRAGVRRPAMAAGNATAALGTTGGLPV